MENLKIFENEEFGQVRIVQLNDEPWFAGFDVADALGYKNQSDAISKHVDEEDKQTILKSQITTLAAIPNRGLTFVNESGLYALIFGSKLESAQRFKHWVTSEILPSLRKNGGYIVNQENMTPEQIMAAGLKAAQQIIKNKDREIERMKPKEIFADAVSASHTSILIGDLAKLLKQNGINTGQKRLFERLRDEGYLIKGGSSKNMPTQKAMEMGLFEVKEGSYVDSNGCNVTTKTTKVTGKGQQYFINRYLGEKKAG